MADEWLKVGRVGVDSGRVLLVDPCYAADAQELLGVRDGQVESGCKFGAYGYATQSGFGDGVYDVYESRTKDGDRVKAVMIRFLDDEEDYASVFADAETKQGVREMVGR